MIVEAVSQGLCGSDCAEQDWQEQPERTRRTDSRLSGAASVKLRPDESIPFHSANP